ncbi:MAG: NAD(P)H-quinone oxidoreductase [Acidobacteriota bacterium]
MRALEADPSESGGEPVLRIVDAERPQIAADEMLVGVRATALNRADLLQVRGFYPPPPGESEIPGLECAGEVLEVGSDVESFAIGDRVMALLAGGGHATEVAVPAAQAMPIPEGLSWAEAAALPEAALTCWTNLVVEGQLQPGQTCVITAAASGIGTFGVQLARALGATTIAAGRDGGRLQRVRELGADHCVLLDEDLVAEVRRLTDGRGADLVMDLVGGAGFKSYLEALATRGRLVLVGLMAGPHAELDLSLVLRNRLQIVGSVLRGRSRAEKAGLVASFWEFAREALADGTLRPVVDSQRPFEELPEAYAAMAKGGQLGKMVLITEPA